MKEILLLLILFPLFCFSQTMELEEQSMSVCYMNDAKRSDILAINKVEAEVENLTVKAYFDCGVPMSEACGDLKLEKYKPNTISVNGHIISLGGLLNGYNILQYNVGRFFYAKEALHRHIIFEMADLYCPNVSDNYCYVIICLNSDDSIDKYVLYNKESNEATEEELVRVLQSIYPNVDKKDVQNESNN